MSNNLGNTYNPDRDFLSEESEAKSLQSIRARIDDLVNEEDLPPKRSSKKSSWLYLGLVIILVIGVYLIWKSQHKHDVLPMAYFKAFPNYEQIDTRGQSNVSQLKIIYEAYDNHDFKTSVELFSNYSGSLTPEDQLYYAIALQGSNNWEQSKEILLNIQSQIKPVYRAATKWYLTLAHLQADERSQTIKLASELKAGNSTFRQRASDLLNELNE